MNKDIITIIEQSTQESFKETGSFPERVKTLTDAGIERYYADLVGIQTTYYATDGSIHTSKMPYPNSPIRGRKFLERDVIEALRTIQRGEIIYSEFLDRIIKGGTVNYTVFLLGKQAHYVGAKGEIYIERFPGKNQND